MDKLNRHGKAIGSQNGEAGIIRYIFDTIGSGSKGLVEIGFGRECNAVNLLSNYGWWGWLFDAEPTNVLMAQLRWLRCKPFLAFVSVENINKLMEVSEVPKEVDMLSIDIDGNDYWVWKAMTLDARMVVIEYNASFGSEESITIKYDPEFSREHINRNYHGASLRALTRLAKEKGMSLVGCEGSGVNAFFVKDEYLTDELPAVSPEEAYYPHRLRGDWVTALAKIREQGYELVEV